MKLKFFPYFLIVILWFLFSLPIFIQGKVAFPSSYQANNYSPWSTYSELAGPVKNNAQPDIITQIYPWRHFAIEELKKGRLPLWNPYSFAGNPHLANYQSAVLFPLNVLYFLPIPFIDVWSLLVVAQPLLAGIFTYIFARKLRISTIGSVISSISFMFCGFIVTWMGYSTLGYAILPLPIALFAIESYTKGKEIKYGVILSLSILFSFFSGHFQTSLYFLLAVVTYGIFKLFVVRSKHTAGIFYFILVGLLLSMPQVLPSIELYLSSVRSDLFQKMEAIPWSYLPTLIAPDFYGNPVTRNDWFGHYAEWNGYIGSIGIVLALFAVFNRTKKSIFFIGMAVVSFLLAFNTPLLSLLVMLKVPVLSTSAASRIIVLFSFSLAMLAGFGLDSILSAKVNRAKVAIFACSVAIIFATCILVPFMPFFPSDKSLIAQKNIIFPSISVLIFIVLLVLFKVFNIKRLKVLFIVVIVLLSGFETYRFAAKWQSFDDKSKVFATNPTTEYYSKYDLPDRFFGDFTAENSVYYGLPILSGYDPLYIGRYGEFARYVYSGQIGQGERSVVNFPKKGDVTAKALDFLGVKYIAHKVSDGALPWAFPFSDYPLDQFEKIYDDLHYQIFKNRKSFPRAFVVNKVVYETDKKRILEMMFDLNLKNVALVEQEMILDQATGSATIETYEPAFILLKVTTTGRSLLVLTDNYYPGWKVKVNGQNQQIHRVDYSFRGVILPKGSSVVEFYYQPLSFDVGVYMFLLGVLAIITLVTIKKMYFK